MFTISIKTESGTSSVPVSRVSELEQAISFGFQLHQASTCKHCIVVSDGQTSVATFVRLETFTLPAPAPTGDSSEAPKKQFGLRRK